MRILVGRLDIWNFNDQHDNHVKMLPVWHLSVNAVCDCNLCLIYVAGIWIPLWLHIEALTQSLSLFRNYAWIIGGNWLGENSGNKIWISTRNAWMNASGKYMHINFISRAEWKCWNVKMLARNTTRKSFVMQNKTKQNKIR